MEGIAINKTGKAKDALSLVEADKYFSQDKSALVRRLRSPTNSAYLLFSAIKFRQKPITNQYAYIEDVGKRRINKKSETI